MRAVDAWVASDKLFHVMRDWWKHADIMLAGLWGGTAGVQPRMKEAIEGYVPSKIMANVDQLFLHEAVWRAIAWDALAHDRFFSPPGASPFPETPHPDPKFHVGQDEYTARKAFQETQLGPWIAALPRLDLPEAPRK